MPVRLPVLQYCLQQAGSAQPCTALQVHAVTDLAAVTASLSVSGAEAVMGMLAVTDVLPDHGTVEQTGTAVMYQKRLLGRTVQLPGHEPQALHRHMY